MSCAATKRAVLLAIENDSPCADWIIAVLTPITSPRVVTSGPPELPGFSAASLCRMSSIRRPVPRAQRSSQRADDAAGDRVLEAERIADGDGDLADADRARVAERRPRQRRRAARGDPEPQHGEIGFGIVADHVGGEGPPVGERHCQRAHAGDHVAVVTSRPSGVKMKPEPRDRPASMLATAGPTASTARITACE
jgi:hypothetical protein